MKKIIIPIFAFASLGGYAQGKISFTGLDEIDRINTEVRIKGTSAASVEAIVTMNEGWTGEGFEACGATIVETITDTVLIVEIPVEKLNDFAALDEVFYIDFGQEQTPMLDFARPASGVSEIQGGFELDGTTLSFDGTGVLTGLVDIGIDPNHINFTDADGNSRVKAAYNYNNATSATTATAIRRFTTDNAKETHGTHVAGIMAGGYKGNGKSRQVATATGSTVQTVEGPIPYYGVASNAELVMVGGQLTDANILKGVKAIISYAEKQNMPAVVNLSLGTNNGPHDGTGSLEKSINDLGDQAIICISAGNEGDTKMFIGKEFTAEDTELKTFVKDNASSGIDIWTNGTEPITVTIAMFDATRRKLYDVATTDAAGQSVSSTGTSDGQEAFAKYISGSFTMRSEVNRLNNRYHVAITGTFKQLLSGQNVALIITGGEGQRVWVYGYGNLYTAFTKNGVSGYEDGTTDGTISNVACGDKTIAVGSYNSRTTWGTFAGLSRYAGSYKVDGISPFSSYGTNYQGVELPAICAPGANIISSLNRYYTSSLASTTLSGETSAEVTGTITNYWGPMQGTSMSSPYAAGVVALWLQADPTLDVATVLDIMKKTATAPQATGLTLKQWGGGRLNALAGIKEILNRKNAGIDGILADTDDNLLIDNPAKGIFAIAMPGAAGLKATLYSTAGIAVATASTDGNDLTLDAAHAAPGIYVLAIESSSSRPVSRKVVIR